MNLQALLPHEKQLTEQQLNEVARAPSTITRYVYNAHDLQGTRFVEDPMSIFGGIRYIREDLCTIKEGVEL